VDKDGGSVRSIRGVLLKNYRFEDVLRHGISGIEVVVGSSLIFADGFG
jgi:hypothetical protein